MPKNHTQILYALIVLLFVVLGYLLYQSNKPASNQAVATSSVASQSEVIPNDIVIGNNPLTPYMLDGNIVSVTANLLVVKDIEGSTTSVTVTPSVVVKLIKELKTQTTQQKELDAYNAQVAELLKDPVKNKAALAALKQPTPRVIVDGKLADLQAGDSVSVQLSNDKSAAVVIYKDTLLSPSK